MSLFPELENCSKMGTVTRCPQAYSTCLSSPVSHLLHHKRKGKREREFQSSVNLLQGGKVIEEQFVPWALFPSMLKAHKGEFHVAGQPSVPLREDPYPKSSGLEGGVLIWDFVRILTCLHVSYLENEPQV